MAHSYAILKLFACEPIGSVVAAPTVPVSKGYDVPARNDVHMRETLGYPSWSTTICE